MGRVSEADMERLDEVEREREYVLEAMELTADPYLFLILMWGIGADLDDGDVTFAAGVNPWLEWSELEELENEFDRTSVEYLKLLRDRVTAAEKLLDQERAARNLEMLRLRREGVDVKLIAAHGGLSFTRTNQLSRTRR